MSAENQRWADIRIPLLLDTPAAVRFVSCEPLLGPIYLRPFFYPGQADGWISPIVLRAMSDRKRPSKPVGLDWVIVGGESGAHHRPMDVAWAESLADQCAAAGVPLWMKQDSGPRPGQQGRLSDALWARKDMPERGEG